MAQVANAFRQALEQGEFVVTCEMIPGRGAQEKSQERAFKQAQEIAATGRVHAISITDNPGGNPSILADEVALELLQIGITPLVHFTCKDRNRNQMQSQLYALERSGIENLLYMTGDYQASGYQGTSRPVFDFDPIHALQMTASMNAGLQVETPHGSATEQPTHFYAGAVVNPFKYKEGEVVPQYLKLEKKIIGGAEYIISQLGYDVRKMQELVMYVEDRGYKTPLIANIFILNTLVANLIRKGVIAGCYVNDELMATLEKEEKSEDKGKAARYERAAKMVAVAQGLGYAGVHIGGFGLGAEAVTTVLDRAAELADNWRDFAAEINYGVQEGYYVYEPEARRNKTEPNQTKLVNEDKSETPDEEKPEVNVGEKLTGLNRPTRANQQENIEGLRLFQRYGLSRFFHYWVLTPGKRFYNMLAKKMDKRDCNRGVNRSHGFEHATKAALYGCMDCGDCGLEACVYSCPMAQCPKCQRNGPCGGSDQGWCEVYPGERYCIHYKAYHRLKRYGEKDKITSFITPPNNWGYYETSAWSNYTHKRDNAANRMPVSLGLDEGTAE